MNADILLHSEVQSFLTHEANLLDSGHFEEWLELFNEDGVYWIPSSPTQEDMHGQVSIILEDKNLLKIRVARLSHPKAHAVNPRPTTVHMVGNISADMEGELVISKSKLIMTEFRNEQETCLGGSVTHRLRKKDDKYGIQLKRVDLIQADGTFSVITVPL